MFTKIHIKVPIFTVLWSLMNDLSHVLCEEAPSVSLLSYQYLLYLCVWRLLLLLLFNLCLHIKWFSAVKRRWSVFVCACVRENDREIRERERVRARVVCPQCTTTTTTIVETSVTLGVSRHSIRGPVGGWPPTPFRPTLVPLLTNLSDHVRLVQHWS